VTILVTTALGNARPNATSSDAAPGLACGNRTQRDAARRNHAAWHAEGLPLARSVQNFLRRSRAGESAFQPVRLHIRQLTDVLHCNLRHPLSGNGTWLFRPLYEGIVPGQGAGAVLACGCE
jgi:hypothetical protein